MDTETAASFSGEMAKSIAADYFESVFPRVAARAPTGLNIYPGLPDAVL